MENYKKRQECSAQIEDVPKWRMIYDLLAEPTFLRPWLSMLVVTIAFILIFAIYTPWIFYKHSFIIYFRYKSISLFQIIIYFLQYLPY